MGFKAGFVDAVKAKVDLVDLVGRYTQLSASGRRLDGACPRHGGGINTPNLAVWPERKRFRCWACQWHGDALDWLAEVEHLDFAGGVERLADMVALPVEYEHPQDGEKRQRRSDLVGTLEATCEAWRDALWSSAGRPALDYLLGRGLSREALEFYRVGWATVAAGNPDMWEPAGLNRKGDFFRGRVVFPILDVTGRVVSFSGRTLPGEEGEAWKPDAKYLNGQGTAVFEKSRVLHGLYEGREAIVRSGRAVVCEGAVDVVAARSAGVEGAVAACGTGFGEDHARLLGRWCSRAVLAFDPDPAGWGAAQRILGLAWDAGIVEVACADLGLVDVADAVLLDPDELVAAVEDARPLVELLVNRTVAQGDVSTPERRATVARAALEIIAKHPDDIARTAYTRQLGQTLGVDVTVPSGPPPMLRAVESTVDDVEREALRWALTDPTAARGWLCPELFTRPEAAAVFAAFYRADTVDGIAALLDGDALAELDDAAAGDPAGDGDWYQATLLEAWVARHVASQTDLRERARWGEMLGVLRDPSSGEDARAEVLLAFLDLTEITHSVAVG